MRAPVQDEVAGYLARLADRLEAQLGDRLLSAWATGSSALGDFDRRRSDVDVQAVSSVRLSRPSLQELAATLSHPALPCPVRGLEFVLYAREDLDDREGPAFQLNLNTGAGMTQHEGFDPRSEPRFWFTLDIAITRERACTVSGVAPPDVLPTLPRRLILGSLRDALRWYRGHDDAQAVLAACRVWAWTADARWLSKGDAATWAIARLTDPAPVTRALQRRGDPCEQGPAPSETAAFLEMVESVLEAAASQ